MVIKNITDIEKVINESNFKIFGIGGLPITRSEIWPFIRDYELICSNATGELESVREDVEVKIFEMKNKSGAQIKNPGKILVRKEVVEYIKKKSKNKKVGIYVMKPSREAERICEDNNWYMIANPLKIFEKFDEKVEFYKILKKIKYKEGAVITRLGVLEAKKETILKRFKGDFVIQLSQGIGGGRGTFFIKKQEKDNTIFEIKKRLKILKIKGDPEIIINDYFEGPSLSITVCVTKKNGVLVNFPRYQLIDIQESVKSKSDGQGVFCGNDWSLSSNLSNRLNGEAIDLARKIGEELNRSNYRGIFGIDFIWDKIFDRLVPIEINPRLLGNFPTAVHVQLEKKEVPLIAFHVLEFLKIPYEIKSSEVYRRDKKKKGAHLIIFNPLNKSIEFEKDFIGGVYRIDENGKLIFLRLGFELKDLKNRNEFIITDGVPIKRYVYGKNRKLFRIITKNSIAERDGYELNDYGKKIVNTSLEYFLEFVK